MSKANLPASKDEWFFENYVEGSVFEVAQLELGRKRYLNLLDAMIHSLFTQILKPQKKSLQRFDRERLANLFLNNASIG